MKNASWQKTADNINYYDLYSRTLLTEMWDNSKSWHFRKMSNQNQSEP